MKEKYFLQLNENFQRFYYSQNPVLSGNEVKEYPLDKGVEISTYCGFLEISACIESEGEICGACLDYYDNDGQFQSARITPDRQAHIRLIEGEGDVYRVSDCTFKIVKKRVE